MSRFQKITVPSGEKITVGDGGRLQVPDHPIVAYIQGDGIGPDITAASMHIWNSAMKLS